MQQHTRHSTQSATRQPAALAGADVVGGEDNTSGPGPEIMAAETLQGDKVVNSAGRTFRAGQESESGRSAASSRRP